ncbi:ABC transporter, ATP-binding protein [Paenibacillus riograndensis SBR5]|uniref:ABC transporter, ATP-binding protein n=1 Tax=Paenibacillus riograndensis SBR5 TaxID=1073571 RepID=A0A0E4H818_9BACL|nr:ABC transporter, ATP-binding protein [Paenibacillus riograndensis SBR5]
MLVIEKVGKRYNKNFWGIKDINLELKEGIIGLLGPNGAGKSTLMRILATISQPTQGRVTWNGRDLAAHPDELRRVLGYLPQDFGVYPNLTAVEFLQYMAAVKGLDGSRANRRIDELLELLNLNGARKRKIGGYSGGMKQRIGIAQALLNDPKVLIVDEPTVGLDPEERMRFRNLLADLSQGRIILFSTHIVSDIEATADRIVILAKSRLLADAPPSQLLKLAEGKVWSTVIPENQLQEARSKWLISGSVRIGEGVRVRMVAGEAPAPDAVQVAPDLEDAYLFLRSGLGDSQ